MPTFLFINFQELVDYDGQKHNYYAHIQFSLFGHCTTVVQSWENERTTFILATLKKTIMHINEHINQEFCLAEDLIYLNHAAVAPWPQRTKQAVQAFAEENATLGSRNYLQWVEHETELRSMLATLINAPSKNDIALLKNTSEALSVVAHGLNWQAGENVVISDQEFPSNRIVWESLACYGVNVKQVDLQSAETPEQALLNACDENTRLLAISSVQYASGLRMALDTLGKHCRANNILFCVDAIQSIGAVEFDVQACQADFVMADGHKWMLGPEGLALFYCRAALRDELQLHQYGWHMVEHAHDFSRTDWQAASTAVRFECGSPNMLCNHALRASTSLLLEIGMDKVEQAVLTRTEKIFELLDNSHNLQRVTLNQSGRYAGITTFTHQHADPVALYEYLMSRGVMCAPRGGGVRYSPHFYTDLKQIEFAINIADKYSTV